MTMMMTSLSALVLVAALIILSNGSFMFVISPYSGYDTTRIDGNCSGIDDRTGKVRDQALKSMDYVIPDAAARGKILCGVADGNTSTIWAAAKCTESRLDFEECKLCLYNAQFRVVDNECPGKTGGSLELVDCYVKFGTEYSVCPRHF